MHNKIFIIISLLCVIASASALDDVNKNLCNIENDMLSVTITCTPRANEYNVSKITLRVYKDLSSCHEKYVNNDGTYSTNHLASNISTFTEYDEYGVILSKWSNKEDTNEACLFLYNEYKKAARRW